MSRIYGVVTNVRVLGAKVNRILSSEKSRLDHYVIRAGESAPVIRELNSIDYCIFGYSSSLSKRQTLLCNAPEEELLLTKDFRASIRLRRCLVPATHFIATSDNATYCVHLIRERPFFIAGIWDSWTEPSSGEALQTFALVTCASNRLLSSYGIGRMPLILTVSEAMTWIRKTTPLCSITQMCDASPSEEMDLFPIDAGKLKNRALNNAGLLQPAGKSHRTHCEEAAQAALELKRQAALKLKDQKSEWDAKMHQEHLKNMGLT